MNYPLLTPGVLVKFYKPMGREIPEEEWNTLLSKNSWGGENNGAVVHVILNDGKRFAFVKNKKDVGHDKQRGIGIPSKELLSGETPIEAAKRAVKDELGILAGFQISEKPILIRLNGRNVIHITFVGKADLPSREIKRVENDEIKEAIFTDPFSSIRIHREKSGDKFEYRPKLRGRYLYKSHLGLIAFFLKTNSQA